MQNVSLEAKARLRRLPKRNHIAIKVECHQTEDYERLFIEPEGSFEQQEDLIESVATNAIVEQEVAAMAFRRAVKRRLKRLVRCSLRSLL